MDLSIPIYMDKFSLSRLHCIVGFGLVATVYQFLRHIGSAIVPSMSQGDQTPDSINNVLCTPSPFPTCNINVNKLLF